MFIFKQFKNFIIMYKSVFYFQLNFGMSQGFLPPLPNYLPSSTSYFNLTKNVEEILFLFNLKTSL